MATPPDELGDRGLGEVLAEAQVEDVLVLVVAAGLIEGDRVAGNRRLRRFQHPALRRGPSPPGRGAPTLLNGARNADRPAAVAQVGLALAEDRRKREPRRRPSRSSTNSSWRWVKGAEAYRFGNYGKASGPAMRAKARLSTSRSGRDVHRRTRERSRTDRHGIRRDQAVDRRRSGAGPARSRSEAATSRTRSGARRCHERRGRRLRRHHRERQLPLRRERRVHRDWKVRRRLMPSAFGRSHCSCVGSRCSRPRVAGMMVVCCHLGVCLASTRQCDPCRHPRVMPASAAGCGS
jgi:hypothetical protein